LNDYTGTRPHQNVVLKASKLSYINIKTIQEVSQLAQNKTQSNTHGHFYLFLDGITDPQNFGSILRSALFMGVDAIIVNK
jgi:tRNA G18 (ribose-2'-O)-methylase SpoU